MLRLIVNIDGTKQSYTLTANQFNIAGAPLSFVRSGVVYLNESYLVYAGVYGLYWSSTASSSISSAYRLHFDSGNVYPTGYHARYGGRSLRCLQE